MATDVMFLPSNSLDPERKKWSCQMSPDIWSSSGSDLFCWRRHETKGRANKATTQTARNIETLLLDILQLHLLEISQQWLWELCSSERSFNFVPMMWSDFWASWCVFCSCMKTENQCLYQNFNFASKNTTPNSCCCYVAIFVGSDPSASDGGLRQS